MSRFHGNTQPPAGSVLEQLLAKYVDYMDSLRRESFLDDQFTQLLKLQDENNPDFVGEVVSLFFQDSERLIGNMGTALGKKSVDYKQVDADVHQLKGSSSSIGAVRIKNVCVFFRNLCEAKNLEGCRSRLSLPADQFQLIRDSRPPHGKKVQGLYCLDCFFGKGGWKFEKLYVDNATT